MSHGAGLLVVAALWGLAPRQHSCAATTRTLKSSSFSPKMRGSLCCHLLYLPDDVMQICFMVIKSKYQINCFQMKDLSLTALCK